MDKINQKDQKWSALSMFLSRAYSVCKFLLLNERFTAEIVGFYKIIIL